MSIWSVPFIFVVQDTFSKMVCLYSIKQDITRVCLNKLINDYLVKVGNPQKILAYNENQFMSHLWRSTLEEKGIQVLFSLIRHSQSNPVKRTMRELERMFRRYCDIKNTSWANCALFIQDCLNYSAYKGTNENVGEKI